MLLEDMAEARELVVKRAFERDSPLVSALFDRAAELLVKLQEDNAAVLAGGMVIEDLDDDIQTTAW